MCLFLPFRSRIKLWPLCSPLVLKTVSLIPEHSFWSIFLLCLSLPRCTIKAGSPAQPGTYQCTLCLAPMPNIFPLFSKLCYCLIQVTILPKNFPWTLTTWTRRTSSSSIIILASFCFIFIPEISLAVIPKKKKWSHWLSWATAMCSFIPSTINSDLPKPSFKIYGLWKEVFVEHLYFKIFVQGRFRSSSQIPSQKPLNIYLSSPIPFTNTLKITTSSLDVPEFYWWVIDTSQNQNSKKRKPNQTTIRLWNVSLQPKMFRVLQIHIPDYTIAYI